MIIDNRKQVVISERSIRCKLTGMRITNRIELNEESVPPLAEHVTMESSDTLDWQGKPYTGVRA